MIKKPSEAVSQFMPLGIIIAGYPGIGKSTLALSAPRPLHIDVDKGITRVKAQHRKSFDQPETYEELLSDLTAENLKDFDSIVIDTGGKLLELMKPWAIKLNAKNGQTDGSLSQKGYGIVGKEFARLCDYCRYELKKNLIVVFHAKEDKDGETTKLRILVEGQTKDNVWQPMDLGGFMEMYGKKRTIGFSNCEKYFAKGTHGISGIMEIPDSENAPNDFLTKLFEKVNQNITDEAELFETDRKAYDAVMTALLPQIETMTGDSITNVQSAIKSANHVLTSEKECKALFSAKLKEIGYKWDKGANKYVKSE